MLRLTADEFVDQIANSVRWGIFLNDDISEIELITMDSSNTIQHFLGPEIKFTPEFSESMVFLARVDECVKRLGHDSTLVEEILVRETA